MNLPPSIKGALKSLTVWFAMAVAAAPDVLDMLQQNFDSVRPYVPTDKQAQLLHFISLVILLLRMRTTASLAVKGKAAGQ